MTQDPYRFEYVINADDVIVEVNPPWEQFASENSGEALVRGAQGTWLWQHLAGSEVKHLYRTLLEKVRETGRPVTFPFRCDAPDLKRSMMMEVTPRQGGVVHFSSWILEETRRPAISLLAPDRAVAPRGFLRMCAWCKRIAMGDSDWAELEEALEGGALFDMDPLPKITHGVCSDCQAMILREVDGAA